MAAIPLIGEPFAMNASPGPEPRPICAVRSHRLLYFGIAAEARFLDVQLIVFEDPGLHADVERHE